MGAKVQYNGYFTGYCHMKDLNDEVRSNSWSRLYDDRMFKGGQYCSNGFIQRSVGSCYGHDREVLKQTMLKHEAIFKKQVYELHRLYRVQQDLMNNLPEGQENGKYSFPPEASHSNSYLLQVPSDDSQRIWRMPISHNLSTSCTKQCVSLIETKPYPLPFFKEMGTPVLNGSSQKDGQSFHSRKKKCPRRTFDLELPADEYIDVEDEEPSVKEIKVSQTSSASCMDKYSANSIPKVVPENEVKLSLGSGFGVSLPHINLKTDLDGLSSSQTPKFSDLNKEIQESSAANFAASVTVCDGTPEQQVLLLPDASSVLGAGLPADFSGCRKYMDAEHEDWHLDLMSKFGKGHHKHHGDPILKTPEQKEKYEKFPIGYEGSREVMPLMDQCQTFRFQDQRTRFVESTNNTSIRTGDRLNPMLVSPSLPGSLSFLSQCSSNYTTDFPWRTSVNDPRHFNFGFNSHERVEGDDLSRTSAFFIEGGSVSDKFSRKNDMKGHPSSRAEISFGNHYSSTKQGANGAYPCFPSMNHDSTRLANGESLTNGYSEDQGPNKISKGLYSEGVWSRKKSPSLAGNGFLDELRQGRPSSFGVLSENWSLHELKARKRLVKPENDESSFQGGLDLNQVSDELLLSNNIEERKLSFGSKTGSCIEHVHVAESRSRSGHVFGPKESLLSLPATGEVLTHSKRQLSHNIQSIDVLTNSDSLKAAERKSLGMSLHDLNLPAQEKEPSVDGTTRTFAEEKEVHGYSFFSKSKSTFPDSKHDFILHTRIEDNYPHPSGNGQQTIPPGSFNSAELLCNLNILPGTTSKCVPIGEDSGKSNQILRDVGTLGNVVCPKESKNTLDKVAADTLFLLSSLVLHEKEEHAAASHRSCDELTSPLNWFADVCCEEGEIVTDSGLKPFEEEDVFERMTLLLKDMKTDETFCKPHVQDVETNEQENGDSGAQNQVSKGTSRRARRRRDFQKDILPGLMSLSRLEVSEDIQIIGGLMKASGCFWQGGSARKNGVRNGWSSPTRARRPRNGSIPLVEDETGLAVTPPSYDPETDEIMRLKGISWGKTIRRRRQPRCPSTISNTGEEKKSP